MFLAKLFYKVAVFLFLPFLSNGFVLAEQTFAQSDTGVEIDRTLVGEQVDVQNNERSVQTKEEEVPKIADSYNSDSNTDNDSTTINSTSISQNNNEKEVINEIFKTQIQKAKDIDEIKVINKLKYGNEIADRIDEKYKTTNNKKIDISRTTMKKSTPVKFDIQIKDSADTKTGLTMQDLHSAYKSYMSQDYELAVMFYKKTLSTNPNSVEARFGLGVSYQLLMQFDQAIECYLKILNSKFSRKKIVSNLLLALSHKPYKDALDILLTIDEKILGYEDVLSHIGVLYIKLNDDVKAISALTKAYEIAPTNAVILYNLGILYDRGKNLDYAKHFWDLAIKNDVADILSSEDLSKLQKRLKEIEVEILNKTEKQK